MEAVAILEKTIADNWELVDRVMLGKVLSMLEDRETYDLHQDEYKNKLLGYVNKLVMV